MFLSLEQHSQTNFHWNILYFKMETVILFHLRIFKTIRTILLSYR